MEPPPLATVGSTGSIGRPAGRRESGVLSGVGTPALEQQQDAGALVLRSGRLHSSHTQSHLLKPHQTAAFFRQLTHEDEKERGQLLKNIIDTLRESLLGDRELIKRHGARIVRHATEVPYEDITQAFLRFLDEIHEVSSGDTSKEPVTMPAPSASPSIFIQAHLFPPVQTREEPLHTIFVERYLATHRVSHLDRVLSLHPTFAEKYFDTQAFLMREPGPLPLLWRNYIAILTAARFKCNWLVNWQEQEYMHNGGSAVWLHHVRNAHPKLQQMLPLVQMMAHQPWLVKSEHIEALVKGHDSWSIGELVHAIAIITTFCALSGIVYGCGVTPEIDFIDHYSFEEPEEEEEPDVNEDVVVSTQRIMELLTEGGWEAQQQAGQQDELFAKAEDPSTVLGGGGVGGVADELDLRRYTEGFDMAHVDFDVKSKDYGIFRVTDYSWNEHGYELCRRYLPDAAELLDMEFDFIYNLTYHKVGTKKAETGPFRRAIWQYVQRVKGVFHDDYDYGEVNKFLAKDFKTYIKKITCTPEKITLKDWHNVGYELHPTEKVHIALLAVESARQSALLYGLHAVFQYRPS